MKNKSDIEVSNFDHALSDAFQEDPECGAFGTFDDLSRRRMINDILHESSVAYPRASTESWLRSSGFRRFIIGAAAAVIGFCTVGSLFLWTLTTSQKAATPTFGDTYFGEVQENDGALFLGDKSASRLAPVPVGKSIRTEHGAALLRLPTGIDWRIARNGRARIAAIDAYHLNVEVLSGESWFRVDPKREGPSFSVATVMGRIDVTGTIFVVSAKPSDVRVTVLKGEVWVTRVSGQSELVRAGHLVHLRDGKRHTLAPDEKRHMHTQLTELTWDTEAASVAMNAPSTSDIDTPVNRNSAAEPDSRAEVDAEKADLRHLHEEIQASRKRGDWRRVATLYRRLIQSAPGSEAAIVSRVSLAEIYLTKLHRYNDALVHFDKYLGSGHTALLPEAFFGKCSTLKALGKRDKEAACLDRFIRRFAGAFQVPTARSRLNALRSIGGR